MNYRAPVYFLVILFCLCAAGQRVPGLPQASVGDPGNPIATGSLSGSVRTTDGKAIRNARVELRSPLSAQVINSTYTLPNGSFEFDQLASGHYEVVVTSGVNEVRDQVDVYSSGATVSLHMGADNEAAADGSPGMVSVAQMKVPGKARSLYRKAQGHVEKNKLDDASQELQKALAIAPTYAPALTLRALIAMQRGNATAALPDLESAVQNDPAYGLGYIVLGSAYNMQARYDDAIRVLSRAEALAASAWQLHFELSKALLGKGDYQKSLQQAGRAGALAAADYPPLHLVMAHAYLGLKDYSQAITELEQFISRDPNGADSARARKALDQVRAFAAK